MSNAKRRNLSSVEKRQRFDRDQWVKAIEAFEPCCEVALWQGMPHDMLEQVVADAVEMRTPHFTAVYNFELGMFEVWFDRDDALLLHPSVKKAAAAGVPAPVIADAVSNAVLAGASGFVIEADGEDGFDCALPWDGRSSDGRLN